MSEQEQNRQLKIENFGSWEELYNSVTKEGSLGLLALGYKGLLLWRKKRDELETEKKENDGEKK